MKATKWKSSITIYFHSRWGKKFYLKAQTMFDVFFFLFGDVFFFVCVFFISLMMCSFLFAFSFLFVLALLGHRRESIRLRTSRWTRAQWMKWTCLYDLCMNYDFWKEDKCIQIWRPFPASAYVPVKSKLQHPPPGIWIFETFLFKFPPQRAEKLFKCPHPRENYQITILTFQ